MTNSPNSGTGPLPSLPEVAQTVKTLQTSLGAFVQSRGRGDEATMQAAAARVTGSFRKLLATYEFLASEDRREIHGSLVALHQTLQSLEVPVGPLRISAPPPEPPREPLPEEPVLELPESDLL